MLVKFKPVVNFTSILRADFVPISFYKTKYKYKLEAQKSCKSYFFM